MSQIIQTARVSHKLGASFELTKALIFERKKRESPPGVRRETLSKSTSLPMDLPLECTFKMRTLPCTSGLSTVTCLSNLPGRISAASNTC